MKYKLGKQTLELIQDENPRDPREDDNISKLVFATHGKNEIKDDGFEFESSYESRDDFITRGEAELKEFFGDEMVFCSPVHVYAHGSVAYSMERSGQFNDRWDSGTCGFIIVLAEDLKETLNVENLNKLSLQCAELFAKAELDVFNDYVGGNTYGYSLKDETGEEIDSCWGFFGDDIQSNGVLDHVGEEWAEAEEID